MFDDDVNSRNWLIENYAANAHCIEPKRMCSKRERTRNERINVKRVKSNAIISYRITEKGDERPTKIVDKKLEKLKTKKICWLRFSCQQKRLKRKKMKKIRNIRRQFRTKSVI